MPRKNIRGVGGKPLLAYTVEEALKSTLITEYVVSSDDPEILAVAFEYGAQTIERPAELAQDDTPHLPALIHALDWSEDFYNTHFDVVADLRCTNPFKTALDKSSPAASFRILNPGNGCFLYRREIKPAGISCTYPDYAGTPSQPGNC